MTNVPLDRIRELFKQKRYTDVIRQWGAALAGQVAEVDINPLIAGPGGVVAVDGLVIGHDAARA